MILYPLSDEQMYNLIPENQLYSSCMICKCSICCERPKCRNCYLCVVSAHPVLRCLSLQFQIFSFEPYKSYISELDKIYGLEFN